MSAGAQYQTAPEDRISIPQRLAYGLGAFVNNLLGAASGGMMIVLNLGLGMDPSLVGWLGMLPRLTDAFTDPVMGYVSDNTRSRWGRRRPYIFAGAIAVAIIFAILWQLPPGKSETFYFVYFLVGSILFYLAYTIFATPWVALGYELTPDYNERTRVMGTQNFIGQLAFTLSPWFLWIMNSGKFFRTETGEPDQVAGAGGLAIVIALVTITLGVLPAILLRERMAKVAEAERSAHARPGFTKSMLDFLTGFKTTLKSGPFMKLAATAFLVFNGFMLVASFQFYVIIYYVMAGDETAGAKWAGIAGSVGAVANFAIVVFMAWYATKIGKKRALMLGIGLSVLGYALKWVCYNPDQPWMVIIPAPLISFGFGSLFTIIPSMVADVCDVDELQTKERREGMYGSIFWWVIKLGMSMALVLSGYLLEGTGFNVDLGGEQAARTLTLMRLADVGVPVLTSILALWALSRFPITEEYANQVRAKLEARRGKA